jgi:hypothetical protein
MTKIRDGYIFQDGEHFIVEAESNKAVAFIDRLCGWKWRMLTGTSKQDVHITTDKNTIIQLIKELKNASFNFDNFLEGAN